VQHACRGCRGRGKRASSCRSFPRFLRPIRFSVAQVRHRLELLGAALLFSTGGAAVKATTLNGWQVASFRSGLAALMVWVVMREARRGWTWHVLPAGAAYAGAMILYVTANKLTTAANAIFLQATAPLYVLVLSPLLLREKIRARDLGFMAVVAVGMLLFFVERSPAAATAPDPRTGNLLAAASGVCWAATIMAFRWLGSRPGSDGNTFPSVVAGNLIAFLTCLPLALPARPTGVDVAAVGYLGVFQIGAAYLLLATGIRHVPAVEASTLLLLEPALNPFWAWLVHGERPGAWSLAGGALILGSTLAKTVVDGRRKDGAEVRGAEVRRCGSPPIEGRPSDLDR